MNLYYSGQPKNYLKKYLVTKRVNKLLPLILFLICAPFLFCSIALCQAGIKNNNSKGYQIISQRKLIKGFVYDQENRALSSASISIDGTTKGISTDSLGNFSIFISIGDVLIVNHIGFLPSRIKIDEKDNYLIQMQPGSNKQLDEVVVVGFATQKKESVVGAITTINANDLVVSNTQLSQGFAGRLSGVIAVSPSGEPGNNATNFWIRGVATLGNTTPLIYLDGIEISGGDMNAIDPSNIETFSILKDASSTALYGARGANGVLLITLKHGRFADVPKITGLVENSFNAPTQLVKFTDAINYMNLFNEARFNQNPFAVPKYSQDKINGTKNNLDPYIYPNVDWYKSLFKNFSTAQHANINIRGGSKNARYYSGASFYNEQGILRNAPNSNFNTNILNQRYNFVNNLDVDVSKTTVVELNLNADFVNYNGPAASVSGLFGEVMGSNPVNFPIFYPKPDSASHLYFGNITGGFGPNNTFSNAYADLVSGYTQSFSSVILANLRVTQKLDFLTKGLSFNSIASVKNYSYSSISRYYTPYFYQLSSFSQDPTTKKYNYNINQIGTGGQDALSQNGGSSGDRTIYLQSSLNYDRKFGKNGFTGLLVYQQKEYNYNLPGSSITDALPHRNQGVSGRATYAYDNKYFVEGNFGYTGSENFAVGHKFGFFPSIGVGYLISNEKYFENILPVISSLKIRGSYGLAGNDQLPAGRFPYLGSVNLNAGNGFTFGQNFNNGYSGVHINQFGNPNVQWEVAHKANIGMDITILRALTINVDVFHEKRDKIFQQRATIPSTVGVGSIPIYDNIDIVNNKGIDISLNYDKRVNKDLFIGVKGTFTFARNKVKYYDEPTYPYPYLYRTGQSVNQQRGLQAERLFIDQKEVNNSPRQTYNSVVSPGDIKYKDVSNKYDGLHQIDDNDRIPMGHPSVPEITYGAGFNIIYKKMDAGVFFQGIGNVSFFISGINPFGQYQNNVLKAVADNHWSQNNQNINAFYPRLSETANPNNTQASSWWLRSGAFVRLKNVELGYSHNKHLRFYLNGTNLITFSAFKYWDPELSAGNGLGYPQQRQIVAGAQFNLN